ncbi:MAG: GTPase ObgE [Bacilli bacterium]|nr:GTPase ObgE [Bacilli bacterium]MBR0194067.1 GTPase ObgE [Bacilli bacterium]MBR0301971.1 GTPase ObgE [Bacilli bacterium]
MFIDRVVVEVRSGKGGDGMIAFLHEKYVAKGGPSGGNGGRGASIIFRANKSINTLFNFRHSKVIIGQDGGKGLTKNKYGRGADDVYVDVPVGTVVYLEKDHEFVCDLSQDGQEVVVAKGGRGGRGNAAFKSDKNRVPRIAENGLPGETKRLILELKLLADVGLVGLPNAGKSTLLSVVSNANPEIADYPFTTVAPNLGVVNVSKYETFVMADLPGLIEGAHLGKGLGLTFLRHLERCRVIVHLVSMTDEDPYASFKQIQTELKEYGMGLEKRPLIIVASKMDEEGAKDKLKEFKKKVKQDVIALSSLTHEGVDELINKCHELISKTDPFPLMGTEEKVATRVYNAYKDQKPIFEVVKEKDHVFRLVGESIERTYSLINISTDEGMMRLINYLRKIEVEEALKEAGAEDGDSVFLCDFEFEYLE